MAERCQQSALYRAESAIPERGRHFDVLADAQGYIDDLRDNQWWEDEYPGVIRVEVRFIPGRDSVGVWEERNNGGVMEMAPPHRNELFLLHELTHVLAAARYGSQAHCPWFARTYLEIVYRTMGPSVYKSLYESFEEHKIEHVI